MSGRAVANPPDALDCDQWAGRARPKCATPAHTPARRANARGLRLRAVRALARDPASSDAAPSRARRVHPPARCARRGDAAGA
eukprot:scaffold1903_cov396-Prasinococcus_capsulatus_cf.AAC.1